MPPVALCVRFRLSNLVRLAPDARIVAASPAAPEAQPAWREFEARYGIVIERAARPDGVDAWITGFRRERSVKRTTARAVEWDDRRRVWKLNPLWDWTEQDVWRRIHERGLPVPAGVAVA